MRWRPSYRHRTRPGIHSGQTPVVMQRRALTKLVRRQGLCPVGQIAGWRDRILVGIPADLVGGQAREGSRVTEFT